MNAGNARNAGKVLLAAALAAGAVVVGLALSPAAEASFGSADVADVVIRADGGTGDVIVETREGTAYQGNAATGEPLLTYRNGRIYWGAHPRGLEIFRVKHGCLRVYSTGNCALTIKHNRVRLGHTGFVLYEFVDDRVYVGRHHAIMTADIDLEEANDATKWMVVALLETQFIQTP